MRKSTLLILFSVFALTIMSFNKEKKLIVIDAGHGGSDSGAKYDNFNEKDIVLAIAQKIQQQNTDSTIEIVLLRNSDGYSSLSDRVSFINSKKPDLVLSLHTNFSLNNKDRKGSEIYIQNSEASKQFAERLSKKLGNCNVKEQNLHILQNSESPALLVELGFISNTEDRSYLTSNTGQDELSKKILDFLYES